MKKWKRALITLSLAMMLALSMSVTAFAADTSETAGKDLFQVADTIIRDVYNNIAGISTILAGLMSAIAVVSVKMSNNQQKSDQAWDWLKRIWVAWAVINGIGAFIAYITPLFDGYAALP